MFLCDQCHGNRWCIGGLMRSFGPCEMCGNLAACIDCHAGHSAPRKSDDADTKREPESAMRDGLSVAEEWRKSYLAEQHARFESEQNRDRAVRERDALVAAAERLLEALPRCTFCGRVATRAFMRGGARYCDGHGIRVLVGPETREDAPEYPRAGPTRDLERLLGEGNGGEDAK